MVIQLQNLISNRFILSEGRKLQAKSSNWLYKVMFFFNRLKICKVIMTSYR